MTDYVHILIKRKTKEILYNSFRPHETWDTFLRRIFEEAMKYEVGCMPTKSGAKRIEEVVKK